ncbi:phosphatidylinositide phosphatase SAC2-like isoform X1 [Leucoraja erinacea]|uniref:phosphatidylinositide phosphatase SAC2-like isoform X1 n=1 Tax=Leucoraja erinaceus TaxID=7782 RepID=UPI0024571CEA|nr:phosphatidylinositide phosphatase SAC2-like isoform X1 [Leucoraja erinacea]
MELFQSPAEYTVRGAHSCLSCSRSNGSMEIKAASDVDLSRAVCLGLVEGVVGKFQFHPDLECFLVLIQSKDLVGTVFGDHEMYKITKVAVIPLTNDEPQDLKLEVKVLFTNNLNLVCGDLYELPVDNHINSPSHSHTDLSVLGLLHCQIET